MIAAVSTAGKAAYRTVSRGKAAPKSDEYRAAAGQAGDRNHELTADLLASRLLVQGGRPEAALDALIEVSLELPADHVRGLSWRVELDLARLHVDFGWAASARDHAEQATELAKRDGNTIAMGQALLAEAAESII